MNNQNMERDSAPKTPDDSAKKDVGATVSGAFSKASDLAQEAADTVKQSAADGASTVASQVKEMLDRKVGSGAEVMGQLASSTKRAAEDLDESAPLVAGVVRTFANRIDGYADDLRDQSVDQLVRAASDLTRRQPALVFGLAALAGFLTFRTLKSAPPASPLSNEPMHERNRQGANEFHGT
ncbi:MAG: hypothetical protein E5Y63_31465 [Mesorhizobium sp.]|uniref:hypothetical protein n=1 Tax=Mesorhizobium sp. TaxID=1871066 RepID=UPI000FE706D3|nr:hypothetical protein [Mesorhizobium sp.]RWO91841.1 MAG: hypothetical protein EOQ95_10145 [Mesorhizobium sp.]RWP26046.1 MAG: hypothetical protein EOR03_32890 [Mesorhizobium sp.]RWQ52520.1 MAG: hypothetical protein EOS84_17330 [Mesorhizobium sp.]TIL64689.1 MAG: hypothetical protein E5Y77_25340 [Mesorhizobium sp.]TIM26023.1 MAG: hypothetical protein E5Y63_31465 [Mesorhizobium sp.]